MSSAAKLAAVLSISIPYYLSGLSIAIAFRAGVFNIGNEGQYFVGGLAAALAGIYSRCRRRSTCPWWCLPRCSAARSGRWCPRC